MEYLTTTDIPFAEAKTLLLSSEILSKRIRARVFVTVDGSVDFRKAKAEDHLDVIEADDRLIEATKEFEVLKARRSRAEITIDVFRTLEASRRKS